MSLARFWSTFKLLRLSQPAGDRALYKAVRGHQITSVLEVHVGDGSRSQTLVQWLREQGQEGPIRYAAVDPFDMGGENHMSLKQFHTELGRLGTKPLPVPHTGNLGMALKRVLHTIGPVDLIVLDCPPQEYLETTAAQVLSRLTHEQSIVMGQCAETSGLWPIDLPRSEATTTAAAA